MGVMGSPWVQRASVPQLPTPDLPTLFTYRISQSQPQCTATSICFGFASSRSGSVTISTPFLYSAAIRPVSTVAAA